MTFKNIVENYDVNDLTHEMIHTQKNVSFIGEIEKHIEKIKEVVGLSKDRNAMLLDEDYNESVKSINKILKKRFNYNIYLINNNNGMASTYIVFPNKYNSLSGDVSDYIDGLKYHFDNKDTSKLKDADKIKDYSLDHESMYNKINESFKSLSKDMLKNNLTFDLVNATIDGLPSGFNSFITIDFYYQLHKDGFNKTARELLASIIHEVGHTYTELYNSYNATQTAVVINDVVNETLRSSNGDQLRVIQLAHKRLTGRDLKSNNIFKATLELREAMKNYSFQNDRLGEISKYSSEQLADQFATRFGLGIELSNALSKYGVFIRPSPTLDSESVITYNLFLIFLGVLTGGVVLPAILVGNLIFLTSYISDMNGIKEYMKKNNPYENDYKRILRIKQDYIRQLRLAKKEKNYELRDAFVDSIKSLDVRLSTIDTIMKDRTLFDRFGDWLAKDGTTEIHYSMNDLVQNLMENELHISNYKIQKG